MKLFPWLRRFTRPTPAHRPATFRPRVEGLEDRAVPAALDYATAVPGQVGGVAVDAAVDAAGDAYVSAYNSSTGGGVYEFDPAGHLLHSATGVSAAGAGIALDAAGNVYLHKLATVTELDPTLQQTLFTETLPGVVAGLYGGPGVGTGWNGAIAVAGGKIYLAGAAKSGLPTTANSVQPTYPGATTGRDSAFLAVINPTSPAPYHLTYCTYLGGATGATIGDAATGVAVDAAGDAYLTGCTSSTTFPTTTGAFQLTNKTATGHYTTFVTKIDPSQTGAASLVYSTYLGGSVQDGYVSDTFYVIGTPQSGPAIAVDAAGDAYLTGSTASPDFPTTLWAFQRTFAIVPVPRAGTVAGHAYVTELNPTGTGLVFSTFLGGSNMDGGEGIAVDAAGDVWVTGYTRSADFPTVNPLQSHKATGTGAYSQPNADAYVAELAPGGSALLFSTYFGGSGASGSSAGDDIALGIAVDGAGDVYVGGIASTGFPTTPGAYLKTGAGFLLKFTP